MTKQTNRKPQNNDVVCGRGGLSNNHPGNRLFRRLVQANKELYKEAVSVDHKQMLIFSIGAAVHNVGGRFVQKEDSGQWIQISSDQAVAKIVQALRDTQQTHSSLQSETNETPNNYRPHGPSSKDGMPIPPTVSIEHENRSSFRGSKYGMPISSAGSIEYEKCSSLHGSPFHTSAQVAQLLFNVADEVLASSGCQSSTDPDDDECEPIQIEDIVPSLPQPYMPPRRLRPKSGCSMTIEKMSFRYKGPSRPQRPYCSATPASRPTMPSTFVQSHTLWTTTKCYSMTTNFKCG